MTDPHDPNTIDPRLPPFLDYLHPCSPAEALDRVRTAVIATGGIWIAPQDGGSGTMRGTHLVEISLFGIREVGDTPEIAVLNWTAIATDTVARDRSAAA